MGGKSKAPPTPDYSALAKEQGVIDKEAFEYQTKANRIDQTNPYGSKTYDQDPTTGEWKETTSYNPEYQKIFDAETANKQGLTDAASGLIPQIKDAYGQPLDTSGLTRPDAWKGTAVPTTEGLEDWGKLDFSDNPELADSGFGAVQEVQDAMMSRLRPGLQQGNDAEVARLKAQGITEGSPAWQAAMSAQNNRRNDAEQQALLGAAGEYGNIFNRSLASRKLANEEDVTSAEYANTLRGKQWGEGKDIFTMGNQAEVLGRTADTDDYNRELEEMLLKRGLPMEEYLKLTGGGSNAPSLNFSNSYFNQGNAGGPDLAGAAEKTYNANTAVANANNARRAGMLSGLGSVAGSFFGPIGTAVGGAIGAKIAG